MSWGELDELLRAALEGEVASAVDLVVLERGEQRYRFRAGLAQSYPGPLPLTAQHRFDLASLTKPLVGAAVTYAMIDAGRMSFGAPVAWWLDDAAEAVTIGQLLSHSAGYPAWLPLYEDLDGLAWGSEEARALLMRRARRTPLQSPPGQGHAYSDLGFLTLAAALEREGGDRIDRVWSAMVASPGGFRGLSWGAKHPIATEQCPHRRAMVRGEVHDLNCSAMGGVSTHAGLFGDAAAVASAGQVFLDAFHGRGPLAGDAIRWAWTHRGAGSHWLGWDGRSGEKSSSGALFPDDAVGHLGFTGGSLWISPSREWVVALLSNRVHPSVGDLRIRTLRPAAHEAVVRALSGPRRW